MDLLAFTEFTFAQKAALAFGGAGIGVILTGVVMMLIQRRKKDDYARELEGMKNQAKAEAAKILAQAQAEAKSEFIKHREVFDTETKTA